MALHQPIHIPLTSILPSLSPASFKPPSVSSSSYVPPTPRAKMEKSPPSTATQLKNNEISSSTRKTRWEDGLCVRQPWDWEESSACYQGEEKPVLNVRGQGEGGNDCNCYYITLCYIWIYKTIYIFMVWQIWKMSIAFGCFNMNIMPICWNNTPKFEIIKILVNQNSQKGYFIAPCVFSSLNGIQRRVS